MSALDLIEAFGRTVTVTRPAAGAWSQGYWVENGVPTTFNVTMSVQPLSGEERLSLPEGERTRNYQKAYSPVEIFTSQQVASKRPDVITDIDGKVYEVMKSEYWDSLNGEIDPFWKLTLAEKSVT